MSDLNDNATLTIQGITDAKNIIETSTITQDTNVSALTSSKSMETSKKLLWILVGFFIISIIAIGVVTIVFSKDLSSLLNYEAPLVTSMVIGYLSKAGVENVTKIKNSSDSSSNS